MSTTPAYWALWAKTDNKTGRVHPLICHMIDVAQVALAMWQQVLSDGRREQMAGALGLDSESAGRLIAFWAGLHDLGKASPAFGLVKSKAAAPAVQKALPSPPNVPGNVPHGLLTARLVAPFLKEFGVASSSAQSGAAMLGGHHGQFPSSPQLQGVLRSALGGHAWDAARRGLVNVLASSLKVQRGAAAISIDTAGWMWLAGLVSVADWIGSNDDFFKYAWQDRGQAGTPVDLVKYRSSAEEKAEEALLRLGWITATRASSPTSFAALFPKIAGQLRPVQQGVVGLAPRLDGPSLVLVEAPMGEGKTEAAMYLADHWGTAEGRQGCYFALPTQATSNQIFGRVVEFLNQRFPDTVVNLQLLHGHASLSAEFETLRRNGGRLFEPKNVTDDQGNSSGHVVAAEWFTYRKRGLLAPFGVGTVDQALLAALKTRHVFVRLFGLANKTVIIDEVHAYDTYMSSLLERLLEWLGALGSPVVLLSATLPKARCAALITAYAKGLGIEAQQETVVPAPYPRITWISKATGGSLHVDASRDMARTLHIKWVDNSNGEDGGGEATLGLRLKSVLAGGGCAAVICNTVKRAQDVYAAIKPYFPGDADDGLPQLDLLHARFPFGDRDEREKRALGRFGKPGEEVATDDEGKTPTRRPDRAVLVATQIIEQSLDLDFDVMVSDLAPVDLLLQRSGRLWRHNRTRPATVSCPTLWIREPVIRGDGVPQFLSGDQSVYDRHVLLRSWLALRDRPVVRIPEDIEELIESVYDNRACPADLPAALRTCWQESRDRLEEEKLKEEAEARDRWIKSPSYPGPLWRLIEDSREEDAPEIHQAHQALTRLGDPAVDIVCLFGSEARPYLDEALTEPVDLKERPSAELSRRLLLRSVSIAHRGLFPELVAREVPPGWQLSPLLRRHRLLTFDAGRSAPVGPYRLRLDEELGLVIERS